MDIPKKRVIVKVKPHTITIAPKKPNNGGKGVEAPIEPVSLKKGFLSRCIDVVKSDLQRKKIETDAVMHDQPGWEEYVRFVEMAKKK